MHKQKGSTRKEVIEEENNLATARDSPASARQIRVFHGIAATARVSRVATLRY